MQLSAKLLVAASLVASTYATLQNGVHPRHNHLLRRAQEPKNAADMAKIKDSDQPKDCIQYGDQAMTGLLNKKKLPKPSHIASIQEGDDEAQKIWKEIQDSGIIPKDVKQKKGKNGEGGATNMGVDDSGYDSSKDPDCWWTASQCTKPKHNNKGIMPDIYTCPEPDTYGLTFDDGPYCAHNDFYDYLKNKKLKATLFYIGTNVANFPYQAQRGLTDGHDICVHTWAHRYTTTLSDEQVFAELYYTARVIKYATGVTPSCWRPPFGDVDDRVRAIAAGLGLRTILWEDDTNDWKIGEGATKPQVEQNYKKIAGKADKESPIVLAHELNPNTMQMFMKMEPTISKAYKHIVPLTACQNVTNPYVEDITYPDYNDFINGKTEAKGLPDINSIKTDPNADYKAVALNDQKNGYANPGKGSSSSSSDSKNSSSDSKDSSSDSKNSSSDSNGSSDSKKDSSESDGSSDKGGKDAGFADVAHVKAGMTALVVAVTLAATMAMM